MKIGSDVLKSSSLTYDDGLACHTKPDQDIVKPTRNILALSTEAAIPFSGSQDFVLLRPTQPIVRVGSFFL